MIIAWPEGLYINSIEWTLDRPAQVNRSDYTGARRVTVNPWHGKWAARVGLVPLVGEENMWVLKAFLASLRGPVNTFRLPATDGAQEGLPAATVETTAATGAVQIALAGVVMRPGMMMTINDQLLQITAVTFVPGGPADHFETFFEPPLRTQATAGTAVITGNPTCLVSLINSAVSWAGEPGPIYQAGFDVEEVF